MRGGADAGDEVGLAVPLRQGDDLEVREDPRELDVSATVAPDSGDEEGRRFRVR